MAVTGSISITQNSQNIANNTSSITVKGTATMSGPSYDYYTRTGTITIDGKDYSFSTTFPENTTKTIFSKTVTITHNSEGKKTVNASFSIKTGMTGTLPNGVLSKSTSKTLTTIPRTSKVSLSSTNFNIGSTITINTNRASTSFTHIAVIKFNGSTVRTQTGIGASYSWSTTELYKYIPNANKGTGTITLTTYSGSTNIGSSSVSFTANVTNSNPTFNNFDVEDTNTVTLALTGDKNKYIKKYSNVKVTITSANKMIAKNYAIAKSYNIIAGQTSKTLNYSASDTSTTINNINNNTISVFAIDSRNNQTVVTKSLNVVNYVECLIQSISMEREGGIGTNLTINAQGKYSNINFGKVINSIKSIDFRKKKKTISTWDNWESILYLFEINSENGTFKSVNKIYAPSLGGFELGIEYDVQIRVQDELSEDIESLEINSGKVLMSAIKDEGVCFGGIYDENLGGPLQIADEDNKINIEKELKNKRNIKAKYGGSANPIDPDTSEDGLILTNVNTYDGAWYYIETVIYTTGIRAQIAYGYNKAKIYYRYKYPATAYWSSWKEVGPIDDSGWITAKLNSEFKIYDSTNIPKYRKIGKIVQIVGAVSPYEVISGSSEQHTIFTLPEGYRPSSEICLVCHGSGSYRWLLRINTDGTVTFSRYHSGEKGSQFTNTSTTSWLTFSNTFFVD